jgi:integrase
VAEFLTHLFRDKELCVTTLAGYRSVLLNTLKDLSGTDFSENPQLKKLLASFTIERPRSLRTLPQWDLALVMRRLTRFPFEPMRDAPLYAVSWKTAFLLALASAKRRSELRAFSCKVSHTEKWSSVTLRPLPEFVAKTEVPGRPETRLQDVTLEGLASFAGNMEEDKKLCPVRAIKVYLSRTVDIRDGRKELFVPYKPGAKQSISPATISSWIQKAIRHAYQDASPEEASLGQVRAHDLRAIAASWNLHCSIPLSDILRAAQWRCHTTFTSFYLRDMSLMEDDILRLGPISTGQTITHA